MEFIEDKKIKTLENVMRNFPYRTALETKILKELTIIMARLSSDVLNRLEYDLILNNQQNSKSIESYIEDINGEKTYKSISQVFREKLNNNIMPNSFIEEEDKIIYMNRINKINKFINSYKEIKIENIK